MKYIKIVSVLVLFMGIYAFTIKSYPYNDKKQDGGMTVEEFLKKTDNKDKIVFVYFHADWCIPCVKLIPTIQQIETEQKDNVVVLKIDVDDNPKVALHFEINTLPLFMIYKDGRKVWEHNAFMTKSDLVTQLNLYKEKSTKD